MNYQTVPKPGILTENPRLSVCMIVRDEEKMLPRCLKSVQGVADELIVVDTGSKDNTISIAKDFGAQVYHFKWRDDFAAARNESLKHANSDWILVIDADEELLAGSIPPLRKAMLNPWCLVYVITCDNGASYRSGQFARVGRLFRNHPLVRFSRPCHATVAPSGYKLIAQESRWQILDERRIMIRHYGYEPSEMESRKKYERWLRIMKPYVKENPGDDYMLTRLGETYSCVGRDDEAIVEFKKAIAVNPKCADAHKGLGIVYFGKGMFNEAIVELEKAVATNPKCVDTHNNLGMAYCAKGLLDKAVSEYTEAIAIEPNFAEAHFNLAVAYGSWGLVDEEISEYKKALDMNPSVAEAHSNLGAGYADKGMWDEAIVEYAEALAINPGLAHTHANLGLAYHQKGMLDDAINEFRKALAIDPKNGEVHSYLAVACYFNKQYQLAIEHCDKAISLGYKLHPDFLSALSRHR